MQDKKAYEGVTHPHNSNIADKYQTIPEKKDTEQLRSTAQKQNSRNGELQSPKATKIIEFHSRFVQKQLSKSIRDQKGRGSLAVKSDMNSGKTHAVAVEVHKQPKNCISLLVTHLANLNKSAAKAIQGKCDDFAEKDGCKAKIAVNYTELNGNNVNDASIVTTTPNSLPKVFKLIEESGVKINALFIDESESVAQFLANGTINNKSEAGEAITQIVKVAKNTVLLDAHFSNKSLILFNTFIGGNLTLLKNKYTVWKNYTFSRYQGRDNGIKLIIQKIAQGKKLLITCTTASQAENIYHLLVRENIVNEVDILAAYNTSDDAPESQELKAAKENPKLFLNYKSAVMSPTCGTGISIEDEPERIANNTEHYDSVIAFMIRDKNAPDAYSALQMPFRIRNVKEKHVDIIEIDNIDRGTPESEFEIKKDAKELLKLKEIIASHSGITSEAKADIYSEMAKMHIFYEAEINIQNSKDFYNYPDIIRDELIQKGMTEIKNQELIEVADLKQMQKDAKKEIKERNERQIINAKVIDEDKASEIRHRLENYKKNATADEMFSLRKYNLMQAYHDGEDEPTLDNLKDYLKLDAKGIATGRNNIALSQMPLKDINSIKKAHIKGIGDKELFIEDIASNNAVEIKEKWELFRILADIAGIAIIDGVYTLLKPEKIINKKTLTNRNNGRERSYVQSLVELADKWNAIKPESRLNKEQLRKKPVETVRKLIELHLKIETNKQGLRGVNAFKISEQQTVLDNANLQARRGSFSHIRFVDIIRAHEATDSNSQIKEDIAERLGITEIFREHIARCLEQIPHKRHIQIIAEYLKIASSERKKGDRFTPVANANGYILKQAGLKNSGVMGGKKH